MKIKQCIGGFPNRTDRCTRPVGPRSKFWCDECDKLRIEIITKKIEDMAS